MDDIDTRLTVIEAAAQQGQWGRWTELECWYWFVADPHPRRFRVSVNGHVRARFGDLVARHMQNEQMLLWWDADPDEQPRRLLLVSEVEELPALAG